MQLDLRFNRHSVSIFIRVPYLALVAIILSIVATAHALGVGVTQVDTVLVTTTVTTVIWLLNK